MNSDFSRRLALVLSPILAVGKAVREWGGGGFLPFVLVDYIAVALLLAGAWLASRASRPSGALLAAGWGFTSAMAYMSFFSHVEHLGEADHGAIPSGPLTCLIGGLLLVSVLGLVASCRAPGSACKGAIAS